MTNATKRSLALSASFKDLVRLEPKLRELERAIKSHARRNRNIPKYCANAWWYGYRHTDFEGFKTKMLRLGFDSGRPAHIDERLRTQEACRVGYLHLYNLLPNCKKGCACMTLTHPGQANLVR
jgi:hypothetical protein